jgi:hypothetical protein
VLGRPLVLENVSSYLRATFDEKGEAEFLDELTQRAGCLLLVDVNNIVVSSHNHGFSSTAYLERLRPESVAYMHVAGHSIKEGYRFDDHASLPDAETVALLGRAFERFGNVPCIFEWDENLPDLSGYLRAAHDIDTTPGLRPAVLEQVTKG